MKHHLHMYWENIGTGSADANALNHLRRFGFLIQKGIITPPRGYESNDEDRSAVQYLTEEWDYVYRPATDTLPTDTPEEAKQEKPSGK